MDHSVSLLILALAAALLPGVARWLGVPAMVLEILCGVALGVSGLGLTFSGEWLPFLAELGFLLLLFQAGMDIDFGMLRGAARSDLAVQGGVFAATVALALAAAVLLGEGLFLCLVLTTTSLDLVGVTLRETGESKTSQGQQALLAASLADFLSLLAITGIMLYMDQGLSWRLAAPIPLFVGFALVLRAARLWVWWHPEASARLLGVGRGGREGGGGDTQELGVRFAMVVLFLFVALSELVHVEPVLGAFMGGAILAAMFRQKHALEAKLSGLAQGFFVPLFFISVGLEFDIMGVMTLPHLFFEAQLLVAALCVKFLPAQLFGLSGVGMRGRLRLGALLSSRLSLMVAAATLGAQRGLISPPVRDDLILLAVITCLLGPVLYKRLAPGQATGVRL